MNLFEKMQCVTTDIKNIEKDMTVGKGNYAYKAVGDLQVTLEVNASEVKHRLISIPIKQELVNHEVLKTISEDNKEKLTFVDTVKMTVRIIDLDDITQFIDIESFGKGVDSGDKGFGKASTYARKYALLNAYKIATGEDPDADKSKDQSVAKIPSEKRIAVENYLNSNIKTLQETLRYMNIGEIADATDSQIKTMYDTYKKRGVL